MGSVGFVFMYNDLGDGDLDRTQFALEGELYSEHYTLSGIIGYQKQDDLPSFFGGEDNAGFITGLLRWYPEKSLMIEAGGSYDDIDALLHQGVEKQLMFGSERGAFNLFADASLALNHYRGEDHYESIIAGVRYRFGKRKSLQHIHREDGLLPLRK